MYTAGLPSFTLKQCKLFSFSCELRYVVLVLEAFDGPWSDMPLVPDVVPTPLKKENRPFAGSEKASSFQTGVTGVENNIKMV